MANTNEKYIWDALCGAGFRDIETAGIMGNLWEESGFRPNNLQQVYEQLFHMTDEQYTNAINSGEYSYQQFYSDHAGYGLAQWTYYTRKQAMYNACFPDIGSLEKQTAYLIKELKGYTHVIAMLKKANTIKECSNIILHYYEQPGDQSTATENRRANYAQQIYDRQTKPTPEPAPAPTKSIDELAQEVIQGLWGNGQERKDRLTKAGYDYNAVQKRVNEILAPKPTELTEWYACQCASYKTKNGAVNAANKLKNNETHVYKRGDYYTVAIGKCKTQAEAEKLLPEAKKQRSDAFVTKYSKVEVIQ